MESFACLSTMYYDYWLVEPNKILPKHKKQNLMRSTGSQIKKTNNTKMTSWPDIKVQMYWEDMED